MKKITVLIVDDSALIRKMMTEVFNSTVDIEVIGIAHDPIMARKKIKALNPDVLTLDVEMPKMDGITFLKNLMRLRPMPVVMVSRFTEKGADITLQALEMGAIDFVSKPKTDNAYSLDEYAQEIISKVRVAAKARVKALDRTVVIHRSIPESLNSTDILAKKIEPGNLKTTDHIIALGASTGGTEAIREVLSRLPANTPGIVVTQHIPAAFSAPFARRMNKVSSLNVCQAEDGQEIFAGHVYIAPGGKHLLVERIGTRYVCRLDDGPAVNHHKPAVDVLFRSVAQNAGPNAVAVLLTGMGNDGAAGMREMLQAGAQTIAQDEKSSVVWGMPGEAVKLGAAEHVVSLLKIPDRIISIIGDKVPV